MQVLILGLARQGKALARFYAEQGATVTVSDNRPPENLQAEVASLADLPIRYALGGHPLSLLDDCDLLGVSGGVPLTLPIVQEAIRRGIPLTNDTQEFLRRCPAPVTGITGSAGKTTTTSLVGNMLSEAGFTTWVGGNIGNPLINNLPRITPEHRVVLELSSFQLDVMRLSPSIAGVLNITPNHLDRHKTMAAYIAAKRNIVAHQRADDTAVLGLDDHNARTFATDTVAHVHFFSGQTAVDKGSFLREDSLVLRQNGQETIICQRSDIRLRGFHNVLNVLAAIALANAAGATPAPLRTAIRAFTGVAHRLEEVRRWRGALWVNDSIATAPERVLAALASFDEPLILLAGGRDKDLPWETFAQRVVQRVRVLITFGEAGPLIREHVARAKAEQKGTLEIIIPVTTLEEAVAEAARHVRSGEVVLLSPGGTSFDAFKDFAARGEKFRELILGLEET